MKYTTAYYFLLLYVIITFKSIIPFIIDTWGHTFNEIEHISVVHAKYGSHHLQHEVADSASGNEQHKNHNTCNTEDPVYFHILNDQTYHFGNLLLPGKKCKVPQLSKLTDVFIACEGRPPKQLS